MGFMEGGNEGGRDGNNKSLRDNTVVGVSNRDRAVVKGEEGTFFGNEKENMLKPSGGASPAARLRATSARTGAA